MKNIFAEVIRRVSLQRILKAFIDIIPVVLFCYAFSNLFKQSIEKEKKLTPHVHTQTKANGLNQIISLNKKLFKLNMTNSNYFFKQNAFKCM